MKLTIIPSDKCVYVNAVSFSDLDLITAKIPVDVHALQWDEVVGSIEFIDKTIPNQTVTELPDWANACVAIWQVAYDNSQKPYVPTANENKAMATNLLSDTDWATIPDVSDPTKSNPYLTNVNEFLIYRNAVRQYAINPVAGAIDWPVVPASVWASV
jgi:hypothetical protein